MKRRVRGGTQGEISGATAGRTLSATLNLIFAPLGCLRGTAWGGRSSWGGNERQKQWGWGHVRRVVTGWREEEEAVRTAHAPGGRLCTGKRAYIQARAYAVRPPCWVRQDGPGPATVTTWINSHNKGGSHCLSITSWLWLCPASCPLWDPGWQVSLCLEHRPSHHREKYIMSLEQPLNVLLLLTLHWPKQSRELLELNGAEMYTSLTRRAIGKHDGIAIQSMTARRSGYEPFQVGEACRGSSIWGCLLKRGKRYRGPHVPSWGSICGNACKSL